MKKNREVVLISSNSLISKILCHAIEKKGYSFHLIDPREKIKARNILLLIVDAHIISETGISLENFIQKLQIKFKAQFIVSLYETNKTEGLFLSLADDFHNLDELFIQLEKELKKQKAIKQKDLPIKKQNKKEISKKNRKLKSPEKSESELAVSVQKGHDVSLNTHILLADDSKPVRNFVTKILTKKGYEVDTFVDGQKLIDYLSAGNKGDIILLDNQMPILGGMETLEILKANSVWKEIPVLFLSALTDKAKVVNALELGAADYMEKPFNNNEFLARINVHVRIDHLKKNLLIEKEKSDKLLLNTLPKKIVEELKQYGKTEPEVFHNVSVYFSDIVSFTNHSNGIKPKDLIDELNEIFTEFDTIMEKYNCERIKTIGDAYMAVCGMPEANPDHAINMVQASIEIANYMKKRIANNLSNWELRIGINSGSVVGGVVGEKKYIYDVFGDAINTASRMESNSIPMRINVSPSTYNLTKDKFTFTKRDAIEVKGKGKMSMYFVETE